MQHPPIHPTNILANAYGERGLSGCFGGNPSTTDHDGDDGHANWRFSGSNVRPLGPL